MIFRIKKDNRNPYVIINKGLANDSNLSAKAKGIMFYLLSLPDNWQVYEVEITKHFRDGLKSIRTGVQELITARYIYRLQRRAVKGHYSGYEYWVFETPQTPGKLAKITVMPKRQNRKRHTTNNDLTKHKMKIIDDTDILLNSISKQDDLQQAIMDCNQSMLSKALKQAQVRQ